MRGDKDDPIQLDRLLISENVYKKLTKEGPHGKWCKAEIADIAGSICSTEECESNWDKTKPFYEQCEGDTCPMNTEDWFLVRGDCHGEIYGQGCLLKFKNITSCR